MFSQPYNMHRVFPSMSCWYSKEKTHSSVKLSGDKSVCIFIHTSVVTPVIDIRTEVPLTTGERHVVNFPLTLHHKSLRLKIYKFRYFKLTFFYFSKHARCLYMCGLLIFAL